MFLLALYAVLRAESSASAELSTWNANEQDSALHGMSVEKHSHFVTLFQAEQMKHQRRQSIQTVPRRDPSGEKGTRGQQLL